MSALNKVELSGCFARTAETVEDTEDGPRVRPDLLRVFFDLRDQPRVDLLVAEQDLAVELPGLLGEALQPRLTLPALLIALFHVEIEFLLTLLLALQELFVPTL